MAHGQEVVGFKPWHRLLDGCKQFASYYIKEKLKIKVAKWGTPKKYLGKKLFYNQYFRYLLGLVNLIKNISKKKR